MGFEVVSKLSLPDWTTLTAVYSDGQVIAAQAPQDAYMAYYYVRLKDVIENANELFDWLRVFDRISSSSI